MKIAVGTISSHKLEFLKEIIDNLKINCELFPVEVQSGVSEQPMTSEETKAGSVNRAINALKEIKNADLGLGIEVGYEKIGDLFAIICWSSIVDINGEIKSFCSEPFTLPEFHQNILRKNLNLGDYVREFAVLSQDPEHQKIANDIIYRKPYIINSLLRLFDS